MLVFFLLISVIQLFTRLFIFLLVLFLLFLLLLLLLPLLLRLLLQLLLLLLLRLLLLFLLMSCWCCCWLCCCYCYFYCCWWWVTKVVLLGVSGASKASLLTVSILCKVEIVSNTSAWVSLYNLVFHEWLLLVKSSIILQWFRIFIFAMVQITYCFVCILRKRI